MNLDQTSLITQIASIDGGRQSLPEADADNIDSGTQVTAENEIDYQGETFKWINIIFLPFQNWWKHIIIVIVCTKCFFGPLSSRYPFLQCQRSFEYEILLYTKIFYTYIADPLYVIDTFLHMAHRQITEEALKREYMPKRGLFLIFDILSIVPFYNLFSDQLCAEPKLWPSILHFSEFIIIYRVVEHFSLIATHSYTKLLLGYGVMLVLVINVITSLLLLLTKHGLCSACNKGIYDWRKYHHREIYNKTGFIQQNKIVDLAWYIYAVEYVRAALTQYAISDTKPSTYLEFVIVGILLEVGYLLTVYVIMPKLFAETLFGSAGLTNFQPRIQRILQEIKRRNPSPAAHDSVEKFYSMMWYKQNGITSIPAVIHQLPHTFKIEIRYEIIWPIFHHSPTLRNTSMSFKRYICEYSVIHYKLPGERFYTGPHCYTNLYYVRSGVVQLISADDSAAPLLSVTSGTIFGDISFLIPPHNRKVLVHCYTYCEIISIRRRDILRALHKFPKDRKAVMRLARERLTHAHDLFNCKQVLRGKDRCEDEGVAWIKRCWWDISDDVKMWKMKNSGNKKSLPISVNAEAYHCPKYIGQLVLCESEQLRIKSIFKKYSFLWVLSPNSAFRKLWYRIVIFTVHLSLLIFPPNIVRATVEEPFWFKIFNFSVNMIYIIDAIFALITAEEGRQYEFAENKVVATILDRLTNKHFILDFLSLPIVDKMIYLFKLEKYIHLAQFNRLIKTYMLFTDKFKNNWRIDHLKHTYYRIALTYFVFLYISAFFVYLVHFNVSFMTFELFYGSMCMPKGFQSSKGACENPNAEHYGVLNIVLSWLASIVILYDYKEITLFDIVFSYLFVIVIVVVFNLSMKSKLIATLYITYRDLVSFQHFVTDIKNRYKERKIHPELLKRLNLYLNVNWKYHRGLDIIHPNLLKDEPYDVYWKLHGQVAKKIIGESKPFLGADPALVSQLAHVAKFLIVPKGAIIYAFGGRIETVSWVARGLVQSEYQDEMGETCKALHHIGDDLIVITTYFNQISIKTFTAVSDCEILYLKVTDFTKIMKRYPDEWIYYRNCIKLSGPDFRRYYIAYSKKYAENQRKLRHRTFLDTKSTSSIKVEKSKLSLSNWRQRLTVPAFIKEFRSNPESPAILCWMALRALTVFVVITCFAVKGGSGAVLRDELKFIIAICDIIALIDIIVKMFLPYYDEQGLVITDIRKCAMHYAGRGFLMDILGLVMAQRLGIDLLVRTDQRKRRNTTKFLFRHCHLYLLIGFFQYYSNRPSISSIYIMILMWQVLTLLLLLATSFYYMIDCADFGYDASGTLINVIYKNSSCWMPYYYDLHRLSKVTVDHLHLIYAQSLCLVQSGFFLNFAGRFHFEKARIVKAFVFIFLGIFYWNQFSRCTAFLILHNRGHTLLLHRISQLKSFLESERIDKVMRTRALDYFNYWFKRTVDNTNESMMVNQFGVVFKQDLYYYFHQSTLQGTETLLGADKTIMRHLASAASTGYYLPGEDIIREMQLSNILYIVHRGKVEVLQRHERIAVLAKGDIFGQLQGTDVRPGLITVRSLVTTDLLQVSIREFQHIINDEAQFVSRDLLEAQAIIVIKVLWNYARDCTVAYTESLIRNNIAENPHAMRYDYMSLNFTLEEDPYDSIEYILRTPKNIQFPNMSDPVSAESNAWYSRWLLLCWVIGPITSSAFVLLLIDFPVHFGKLMIVLYIFDVLHVVYLITEYFTMELTVVKNKCVYKYIGWKKLTEWWLYLDVVSLILPILSYVVNSSAYHLFRLVRLHNIYMYHQNFCTSFHARTASVLLKTAMVLLIVHALTCGWIVLACRSKRNLDSFPVKLYEPDPSVNVFIDTKDWIHPMKRKEGCAVITMVGDTEDNKFPVVTFKVPRNLASDYVVALTYIIMLQTHMNYENIQPLTIRESYYKLFAQYILSLLQIWMTSVAINAVYTRLRQKYHYDYSVSCLIHYMKKNNLNTILRDIVKTYTKLLWQRHKGSHLPEITSEAPACLREDILSALYMYHLEMPILFNKLPKYFLRQLIVKFHRKVILPGRVIVEEGDIFPCMFFIHEGEVEKWYTDSNGESQLAGTLGTNGFFGIIPGLFPDVPFQFSYYAHTVVDVLALNHDDWRELLDNYPDIKTKLYADGEKMKRKTADKKTQESKTHYRPS